MIYKYIKAIMITFWVLSNININAQTIRVTSATSQGWAGGICCSTGTNYNIHLEILKTRLPIKLDALWLEGYCRDLSKYDTRRKNNSDTIRIHLQEGLNFTGREYDIDPDKILPKGCYDQNKIGIILEYRIGRKKYSLNLSPFITELEFLAYP